MKEAHWRCSLQKSGRLRKRTWRNLLLRVDARPQTPASTSGAGYVERNYFILFYFTEFSNVLRLAQGRIFCYFQTEIIVWHQLDSKGGLHCGPRLRGMEIIRGGTWHYC
jgi:hypothetical protein